LSHSSSGMEIEYENNSGP